MTDTPTSALTPEAIEIMRQINDALPLGAPIDGVTFHTASTVVTDALEAALVVILAAQLPPSVRTKVEAMIVNRLGRLVVANNPDSTALKGLFA